MSVNGPIDEGLEPNHKNGNRGDNRPSNLELLTKGQNLAHSYRELDRPRPAGERNGRSKLTTQKVADIRALAASGEPKRSLALRFGIAPAMVRRIVAGTAWEVTA